MISVTILAKNAERRLAKVLEALRYFDEVLLIDTGSTDSTLQIAQGFANVAIKELTFEGFGKTHQKASQLAKHDWILSIDSDEVVSEELSKEILTLKLDPNCVYFIPFQNSFNEKWIKWCGWYPEKHPRLYNRQRTNFSDAKVHEKVITTSLKCVTFIHPIYHTPYTSLSDFLCKMERYSTLFAKQYQGKRKATVFTALYHGIGAFFKSYFLKKGFLGGYEGFVISIYNTHTAFYKYLKLREANRAKC